MSLLPTRRRQVRGVRAVRARHPEENDISGNSLRRTLSARVKLQLRRGRLFASSVLRLGVPIQPIPKKLTRPLPVKRAVVFEEGLLFSAFAATDTF